MADIIIFALLTIFFIFRIFRVLGSRTGFEVKEAPERAPEIHRGGVEEISDPSIFEGVQVEWTPQALKFLDSFRPMMPSFDPQNFQEGAMIAFKIIKEAYTQGDLKTLASLLAPSVFNGFREAIQKRHRKGEILENTLVNLRKLQVKEGHVHEKNVEIQVYFMSEQVTVTRDKKGDILSGTPNLIEEIEDVWTFSQFLQSPDPNWVLSKTQSI